MLLRWILASIHLLALGIGLAAIWARTRALRRPLDVAALRRVFLADSWWGIAALLWIGSGLWRLFAETEKSLGYYLGNHFFYAKMSLFVLVLAFELWPLVTLIRWRIALTRGELPDTSRAGALAVISMIETILVVLMLGFATGMARGLGVR